MLQRLIALRSQQRARRRDGGGGGSGRRFCISSARSRCLARRRLSANRTRNDHRPRWRRAEMISSRRATIVESKLGTFVRCTEKRCSGFLPSAAFGDESAFVCSAAEDCSTRQRTPMSAKRAASSSACARYTFEQTRNGSCGVACPSNAATICEKIDQTASNSVGKPTSARGMRLAEQIRLMTCRRLLLPSSTRSRCEHLLGSIKRIATSHCQQQKATSEHAAGHVRHGHQALGSAA